MAMREGHENDEGTKMTIMYYKWQSRKKLKDKKAEKRQKICLFEKV